MIKADSGNDLYYGYCIHVNVPRPNSCRLTTSCSLEIVLKWFISNETQDSDGFYITVFLRKAQLREIYKPP